MGRRVLVVDDDDQLTSMVQEMLKPFNYEVVVAHDGPKAIEQSNKQHLDLILMDIHMPFFSGLWFCNAFKRKSNTRNIPVVIISAALDAESEKKAHELGAVACMKKPFRYDQLLDIVEKNIIK